MDILNDEGKLVFIVISIVIFIELAVVLILFLNAKKVISNSRLVKATVTKLESVNKINKAIVSVSLSFKEPMGKTVETSIKAYLGKYKEGEEVEVLSNKNNPSKVIIHSSLKVRIKVYLIVLVMGAISSPLVLGVLVFTGIAKLPF
ncbi:MAG: DUF3592 domain-containing protein [Alphaproteobacteria bacterium]